MTNIATLYVNKEKHFIQKFDLARHVQINAAWFDADQEKFNDLLL